MLTSYQAPYGPSTKNPDIWGLDNQGLTVPSTFSTKGPMAVSISSENCKNKALCCCGTLLGGSIKSATHPFNSKLKWNHPRLDSDS